MFVLNNAFARDLLKRSDIENALGAQISADLPYDSIAYLKAVNEGNPVVRSAPKSTAANGLRNLANIVLGPAVATTARRPTARARPSRAARQGAPRPVRPPPLARVRSHRSSVGVRRRDPCHPA